MVFHIHKERTCALEINSIANEFAPANERRIVFSDIFNFGIYLYAIMNFIKRKNIKSVSVYYSNISLAVQKRT